MDINIRYFNTDNTILSELFRLEQFQKILLEVKTIYACKFNTTLDSFKNKKINTFISLWIMNQFDNIDITEIIPDPIFPYNGYKNKQLAINLINTNLVKTEEEAYELIQDWDLSQKMTQACVATSKFIQSDEFQVLQHDYKIQTYEEYISVSSQRENTQRESHFKKFKIIIKDTIKDTIKFKYSKPTKFFIPFILYDKLVSKYREFIPSDEEINILITKLFLRYYTLDSENQQLAVMPEFYNLLASKYNIDIELFASGLNSFSRRFASLYYDIEKVLGSVGYFHTYTITPDMEKGQLLVANPPFDEDIMISMVTKFITWLKLSLPISIILTIPQWGEYSAFESLEQLKRSGFISQHWIIPKSQARFYNYLRDKIVYPCNVYLILLQNEPGIMKYPKLLEDIEEIKKKIYV